MKKIKIEGRTVTFVFSIFLFIAGCSGGGGGSDPAPLPNPGPAPAINVALNQIETDCAVPGITGVTAFVTVLDENGEPITVLTEDDFTVTEDTFELPLGTFTVDYADQIDIPLSVATVLDYSGSITSNPDIVAAMEDAAIAFINELTDNDEAEVIKFADFFEVVQDFTSDKALLIASIEDFWDGGKDTLLYDTLIEAINLTATAPDRRAVIILTDGINELPDGSTSTTTANDVISSARSNGVPIFPIGLGSKIEQDVLARIADETGGIFYHPASEDLLRQVYLQLADALIYNQYVIIFDSSLAAGTQADLLIGVDFKNLWDEDIKQFTTCQ